MATHTPRAESVLHNPLTFTLSPGMAPAAPLMRMLARFDRPKVEAFAEISIALLDLMDGDPDAEDDDPDTGVEDSPRGFDPEEDYGIDDLPHGEDDGY